MLFIRAWISGKEPYTFVKELNIEKELCSYVGNESCLFVVNSLGGWVRLQVEGWRRTISGIRCIYKGI